MEIQTSEHVATTDEYQYKVLSEDGDEYTYTATVTNQHYPFEDSSTNVFLSNNATPYPKDHDDIVEKIEESLTTMY